MLQWLEVVMGWVRSRDGRQGSAAGGARRPSPRRRTAGPLRAVVAGAAAVAVVATALVGVPDTPLDVASPAAAVEPPPPPPPIIDRNQLVNLDGLVVPAYLTAAQQFEAAAVEQVRQQFNLPASDATAVMGWGRDQVRAQMWADLTSIIQNGANASRPYEAQMLAWFRTVIQREEVAAVEGAIEEYVKYSGWDSETYDDNGSDPIAKTPQGTGFCNYRMPAGFVKLYPHLEYKGWNDPIQCKSQYPPHPALFLAPKLPSDEEDGGLSTFIKMGRWKALEDRYKTEEFKQADVISWGAASAITLGATLAAAGVAVPLAGKLASSGLLTTKVVAKLFPYAGRVTNAFEKVIGQVARTYGEPAAAALAKLVSKVAGKAVSKMVAKVLAASVLTIIDAVVTIVLTSIDLSQQLDLPTKLAKKLREAKATPPNLKPLAASETSYAGLFTSFMMATVPEAEDGCVDQGPVVGPRVYNIGCANAPTPPAATLDDPVFRSVDFDTGAATVTDRIAFPSPLGQREMVRPSGKGWFVTRSLDPETGEPGPDVQSLTMTYLDWEATAWIAQRVWDPVNGYRFVTSPVDKNSTAADWCGQPQCVTGVLKMIDVDGHLVTVSIEPRGSVQVPEPVHLPFVTNGIPSDFRIANPEPGVTYTWRFSCTGVNDQFCSLTCTARAPNGDCTVWGPPAVATLTGPSISYAVRVAGIAEVTATKPATVPKTTQLPFQLVNATNVITFPQPANMAYELDPQTGVGGAFQPLEVVSGSLRPVALTATPPSVCVIDGVGVLARNVGTCTITATQNGDEEQWPDGTWHMKINGVYPRATPVARTFQVTKGSMDVQIARGPGQYSDPVPASQQVLTPFAPYKITGTLAGCTVPDWLTDGSGRIDEPSGYYQMGGCTGLASQNYDLGYSASVQVLPEDATLENLTEGGTDAMTLRARLTPSADGTPGDVTLAKVDFELFRSGNAGDVPDYVAASVPVGADRVASAPMMSMPADTYRLRIRISEGSRFYAATPVTASVAVSDPAAPAPAPPPGGTTGTGQAPPAVAPAAVTGARVTVARSRTAATVRWTAPPGDVTGYRVRLSRPDSAKYRPWSTTTATRKALTGLTKGARYRVQVTATNATGTGPAVTVAFRTGRAR